MTNSLRLSTPVGIMTLTATETAIVRLCFGDEIPADSKALSEEEATPLLRRAAQELREYFAGDRRGFSVPLAPRGSEFQKKVWEALRTIPYGETRTYKQIAEQIGHNLAFRAVGMANNRNPIGILIPCHRVIGYDGKMTGYAAGIDIKEQLLALEQRYSRTEAKAGSKANPTADSAATPVEGSIS